MFTIEMTEEESNVMYNMIFRELDGLRKYEKDLYERLTDRPRKSTKEREQIKAELERTEQKIKTVKGFKRSIILQDVRGEQA